MTLKQYLTILIKRWQIILVCFLLVGSGTYIGCKLMKPVYQSSALIEVTIRSLSNNQSDYNNLLASDQLVQTEATLAIGDPILREVASHYPGLTVIELAKEVSSTTKPNTQLFEIDVADTSPIRAASLTNDIASTLIKQQFQATQQNNAQAQQQIQQNIDQANQQINDTTTQISGMRAKGGNQGQIALLQAQLSGLQQRYSQWQSALAQLELIQAQSGSLLRVALPALPADKPVRPNTLLYTGIGLLVGLLLGMLLALLNDQLDTRVRTSEEIYRLFGWPVLATIWRAKSEKREDVINPVGNNANIEAYRILRTNIGFSSIDKSLGSMVVTSAMPRDGKSAIAANLAIFMAKAGKNTLLIDADLHRPSLHILFGLPSDKLGLSNAILTFSTPTTSSEPGASRLSLEPFVHSVGIPSLWVMPSGPLPPNPSELLESKVMQRFIAAVANCGVEVVIFDAPPLLGISDASILTSKVDGALVVVDTTRATSGKLKQVKAVLAQTGVRVLGCVANKVSPKHNDTAYTYYYSEESQNAQGKPSSNGHSPTTPMMPSPQMPVSSFEQRNHSN